ncbi:MAG: hypothetical protein M3299_05105 [Thermoproteota archaeon]|nr:hypothetical protein [Thermoproteota archaeon]
MDNGSSGGGACKVNGQNNIPSFRIALAMEEKENNMMNVMLTVCLSFIYGSSSSSGHAGVWKKGLFGDWKLVHVPTFLQPLPLASDTQLGSGAPPSQLGFCEVPVCSSPGGLHDCSGAAPCAKTSLTRGMIDAT